MAISKIETRVMSVLSNTADREYQKSFQIKESAFSRPAAQSMSFEETTLFMVANTGDSLSKELLDFFNKLPEVRDSITKQAFSKQRQNIKSQMFEDLNRKYLSKSYQEHNLQFHGLRLVAIDGSTVEIPNTRLLREHFGCAKASATSASNARAGLNGFYDPLNHCLLKLVVDQYQKNETKVFLENLDSFLLLYPEEPICFLFDRGYISLKLLFELDKRHVDYLFRIPASCYKKELAHAKSLDETIQIQITSPRLKGMEQVEREYYLKQKTKAVRLVQVELDGGETEYLITSLTSEDVPYEEMKEFYYQRWEIERCFNLLKNRLHIENVSARTPLGICQDIQATVFLGNIIEDMVKETNAKLLQKERNKYEYRVNVNLLCGLIKDYFLYFFYSGIDDRLKKYHYQRAIRFLKSTVVASKKGIKNPRNKKVSRNKYKTNIRKNF